MYKEFPIINSVKGFSYGEEPEILYIIKAGHENTYFVVHDDAWGLSSGQCEIETKETIKEKYLIEI